MATNRPCVLFSSVFADLRLLPSLSLGLLLLRFISGAQVPEFVTLDALKTLGNASVYAEAIQLTRDTRNDASIYLVNQSGRVLFPTPYRIWGDGRLLDDPAPASFSAVGQQPKTVTSFSTTFEFHVLRERDLPGGEGLAFIVTGNGDSIPSDSEGRYLGLTNAATNGDAANQLVAVEFDTLKQDYDPDGNHVGLDINGVVSSVTSSLSDHNITISRTDNTFHRAWIDYNGTSKRILVYLAVALQDDVPKPLTPVLNASVDLSDHLPRRAYFGFAASTGTCYEINSVRNWKLAVAKLPEEAAWRRWLVLGLLALGVVVTAPALALLVNAKRKKARRDERLVVTLRLLPGTPREFQYGALKRATNNFDEKNLLGQGGFGIVYRGIVPRENLDVAVKMFSRETMQGDFLAELTIINRLRHKHLVRLLGWCHKKGKLLLVYDYMPNGGLDKHLFNAPPGRHLPWDCRYRILTGVASALHYLHNEYDQKVVHRDLKASNIMLDSDFNAHLGDFGLARAIDNERTSYAEVELHGVPGTMGYIAPECFHTGKATRESDVFGFGAVVLEVVCGRRPRCNIDVGNGFHFLADWVWELHRLGTILDAVDQKLGGEFVAEEAERLLLLGLGCSHPNPGDRPKTQQIVQIISHSAPPPEVPPFRPAFLWQSVTISINDDEGAGEETTTPSTDSTAQTMPLFHGFHQV